MDGKNFFYRWHNAIPWFTVVLPKWFEIAEEMGCEWNSLFQNIRSLVGTIWHSNSRNLAHFRKDLWYITKISWIFHIEFLKIRYLFLRKYLFIPGKENAAKWYVNWRMFFLICSETFSYNGGNDWNVTHYLFSKSSWINNLAGRAWSYLDKYSSEKKIFYAWWNVLEKWFKFFIYFFHFYFFLFRVPTNK